MKVNLDVKMIQLLDSHGQVIISEFVSENEKEIVGKNPAIYAIRPHPQNKNQNMILVEHLIPREVYRDPDADRIITFTKSGITGFAYVELAEGILFQYQRNNLPIKELQAQYQANQEQNKQLPATGGNKIIKLFD